MEVTTMAEAKQLHARILRSGLRENPQNLSKLFNFIALSIDRDLRYARLVLDSLHHAQNSYYHNTMIRAYSQSHDPIHHSQAIALFLSMLNPSTHNAPRPDNFTFPVVLKSCARLGRTHLGENLHGLVLKLGLCSDRFVQNSLIHMYCVCRRSGVARKVFDEMPERDVVSWTSMIDGLVDDDRPVDAMGLFEAMLEENVGVNEATIVSVLRACADSGALGFGRRVHRMVKERKIGFKSNVRVSLIDMYSKCGCIDDARRVFDEIVVKDVFSWTAMICGLASHGHCREAIELFHEMEGFIKPDERTMNAVLSACRNAGLVDEGKSYFNDMLKRYGVRPTIQLYGCVVDLLARAGRLGEAEEFVRAMPAEVEPDDVMWRTLIWACKIHGDGIRGERLMRNLGILETGCSADCGSYVLAGNVYASRGKWQDKARVRSSMNQRGLVKPAGSSRIEIDNTIHEFVSGDTTHIHAEAIYAKLEEIEEKLRERGHEPRLGEVLLEIDNEEKAFQLRHHSEKLAVAFGLIKTTPGSEIRIVKNLRSCEDCHEVMKLVSRVCERHVIVRDRIRFHYFRNGECSCGNYW